MKLKAQLCGAGLLRFLLFLLFPLFPHSVGHLGFVAFLAPHWRSPLMRE